MISRFAIAAVLLASIFAPVTHAAEADHSARNYHLVFHTKLSGESENFGMVVSEGDFSIRISDPDLEISGILDVSEDFMYRLDYSFTHQVAGDEGKSGEFYKRKGKVILEPGETVEVINASKVELGIELKKLD